MVDVRLNVDVILFLKSIRDLYIRDYACYRDVEIHYPRIERKYKFEALHIEMFHFL